MYEGQGHLEIGGIRAEARRQLSGRWGNAILGMLIYVIIMGVLAYMDSVGKLIAFIISGPMIVGLIRFFIQFKRTQEKVPYEVLFSGFKDFKVSFLTVLLLNICVLLWSLLFIIPGIIAAYSYSMALYIVAENPDITASEALRISKEMMKGYKGKLFLLELSFIGWAILSILTLGIGILWLNPYIQLSTVNFYEDLRKNRSLWEINS